MKKFFQKHKNIIMAIVSVALMLSFSLLGSKPKTDVETRNSPAGSLNGRKVTVGELDNAKGEVDLLAEFGLMAPSGVFNVHDVWRSQGGDDAKIGVFWYLICQDAQKYVNIPVPTKDAVSDAAAALTQQRGHNVSEQEVINRLNAASVSEEGLALAVSHYREYERYVEFLLTFPPPLSQVELAGDRIVYGFQGRIMGAL